MKTFGIIGGMGAFASSRLYHLINDETVKQSNLPVRDASFPQLILHQMPFSSSEYFGTVDESSFKKELKESLTRMQAWGVDYVSFACNTWNAFFEEMASDMGMETISQVKTTMETIEFNGSNAPLLVLTSAQARGNGLFRSFNNRKVLEVPQMNVNYMIDDSICGMSSQSAKVLETMLESTLADYPQAEVLLGCTELSVHSEFLKNIKFYDTMQILAENIVRINNENQE